MTARNETTGPYYLGDTATVAASAVLCGRAVAGEQTDWTISASPTDYRPPNWDEFIFGVWTPWWRQRPLRHGTAMSDISGPEGGYAAVDIQRA